MSTIAAAVFDVVAETGGCSMREAIISHRANC
jgi:hypothetical protein